MRDAWGLLWQMRCGDARRILATLPPEAVVLASFHNNLNECRDLYQQHRIHWPGRDDVSYIPNSNDCDSRKPCDVAAK